MALPQRGALQWRRQYFEVGERVDVQPLNRRRKAWRGIVVKAKRNQFGRISYEVRRRGKATTEFILLEELAPGRKVRP